MDRNEHGIVSYVRMQSKSVLFNDWMLFSEFLTRAWEKLHRDANKDGILVEGILRMSSKDLIVRHIALVASKY